MAFLGYLQEENFANKNYHAEFLKDINEEIRRNSKTPFVRNFRENYEDGNLPIYALVEVFSFGTLSKFYKKICIIRIRKLLQRPLMLDIHILKAGWKVFHM